MSYATMLNSIMKLIGERHGERPYGRPIGVYRTAASGTVQTPRWTRTPMATFSRCVEWNTLNIAYGSAVVGLASTLSALSDLSSSISAMACVRCHGPPAGSVVPGLSEARQK